MNRKGFYQGLSAQGLIHFLPEGSVQLYSQIESWQRLHQGHQILETLRVKGHDFGLRPPSKEALGCITGQL